MIRYFNNKWYYRVLSGVLLGLLTWLLAEVLLNLRYRYFEMFLLPLNYLYAAIFGIFIQESVYRSGLYMEKIRPWELGIGKRLLIQLLSGILIGFLWVTVFRLIINYLILKDRLIIFSDELMLFVLAVFLISTVNLADLGWFLNERYRKSLAEIERFRKENAEYQFEMLKLQLNPHFLFNSLNTLSSLVHEDAGKSAEFIRRLSDVYRYVLDNRSKELVSLREEMEFIRAFSFLQGLRFQGMIDFQFDISEPSLDKQIAPMTLQLLIENAVKHNVVSRKMPLWISIASEEREIIVTNNLQPKEGQMGTGVGLKNISSRYEFLTGRKVKIHQDEHLFRVTIPLI
ncbi:MAG: histidine kinase [Bacteroidales bacterium]|nr:histidine kinase [Bacteroidales bacterium]